MQFQSLFKAAVDRPVKVALIGAGEFGLSLIAQSRAMRGLEVVAVVDTRLDAVETKLASNRVPARRVA
jgi:predicted homoserine dehydrogenase-like protein